MKKITYLVSFSILALSATDANAGMWYGLFKTRDKGGFEIAGDWLQLLIPLSGLAYSTAISDWRGDLQWAGAVGATWVTTEVLKKLVHEERPFQPEGAHGDSFPSGHTSMAFAGAGYWQRRYGWEIGAPMYATAAFVGWSRVHAGKHNWTDVIAGAGIGIGFNYLITTRYVPPGTEISVSPTDGGAMLRFNTIF